MALIRLHDRLPWSTSLGPALVVADVVAVAVAGALTGARSPSSDVVAALGAAAVVGLAGLHRSRLALSLLDEVPVLLVAGTLATAVQLVRPALAGSAQVGTHLALVLLLLALGHALVHGTVHLLRHSGRLSRRVVVVGCGPDGRELAATLQDDPDYGLSPVGFVSTGTEGDLGRLRGLPLTLLGGLDSLPRTMAESGADTVVVALPGPVGEAQAAQLRARLGAPAEVYAVSPDVPVDAATRPRERVGGLGLVRLEARPTHRVLRTLRRALIGVAAAASLLCLLPLLALLALPVLAETGGALVRQPQADRAGAGRGAPGRRRRNLWLYRTQRARSVGRPGTTWSVAVTGRPGPVGRLLRRSRLEELPEIGHLLLERAAPGLLRRRWLPTAPGADEPQVDAGQLTR